MLTKRNLIKSIGMCFLLSSANAFASCEAELLQVIAKNSISDSYDVFTEASFGLEKNFQVEIKTQCPVNLIISAADNSTSIFGSAYQQLDFYYHANGAQTQNNQLIFRSLSEDAEKNFSIRFPSKQYTSAGSMEKEMLAQLWDSRSNTLITEKKFTLNAKVRSSAAVYFSGIDQRSMNVDLGELKTGKKINGLPQLRVISTSPYELTFISENHGKLQHFGNNFASIDYQFYANRRSLDLQKGAQKWVSSEMTSYLGQLIALSMTISDTRNKPAGNYRDTLHISVKPSLVL